MILTQRMTRALESIGACGVSDTNTRFGLLEHRRPLLPEIQTFTSTRDTARVSAALLEFDSFGRLVFATREAQTLLGFALEPLWGQSVTAVITRIQRIDKVEHIAGGRISRAPAAQLTATEQVLGVLHASLELRLTSHPLERVTLRFRGAVCRGD